MQGSSTRLQRQTDGLSAGQRKVPFALGRSIAGSPLKKAPSTRRCPRCPSSRCACTSMRLPLRDQVDQARTAQQRRCSERTVEQGVTGADHFSSNDDILQFGAGLGKHFDNFSAGAGRNHSLHGPETDHRLTFTVVSMFLRNPPPIASRDSMDLGVDPGPAQISRRFGVVDSYYRDWQGCRICTLPFPRGVILIGYATGGAVGLLDSPLTNCPICHVGM